VTDGNLGLEGRTVWMVRAAGTPVLVGNVGPDNWVMMPEGESAIAVPSKRRLGVRTMVIDFGSVQGRISVD
jgi:hypothetical protein